jgi:hypothetical protein
LERRAGLASTSTEGRDFANPLRRRNRRSLRRFMIAGGARFRLSPRAPFAMPPIPGAG